MVEFADIDAEVSLEDIGHGQAGVLVQLFSDSLAGGLRQLRALGQG